VFLASPGDLAEERQAAKEVVEEVSKTARELGISLELLGWEDTLPGAQRPQAAINEDLDQADLFVGLLWRRWGQPTGTPPFTSGFEEEFHRASDRRKRVGAPEMWLFFKEIEPAQRQDPGDQLQKVLSFRNRCEAEKSIFFKEFKSTDAWTRLFRTHLYRHIARLAQDVRSEPAGEGLDVAHGEAPKRPPSDLSLSPAPSLLPLVEVLGEIAEGRDPQPHASKDGGAQSARLYLLGSAMLAESGTSTDLLGTHELNTIYRVRSSFEPISIERALLQRTVLGDRANVKPGWYWFPTVVSEQEESIAICALFDNEPAVRRGALAILAASSIRHTNWDTVLFDPETANSQPPEVQEHFWGYLERVVTATDRPLIEAMLADDRLKERASSLMMLIRVPTEPGVALAEAAISLTTPSSRVVDELSRRMGQVDQAVLTAAFASRHNSLRLLIVKELELRGLLDEIRQAAQADEFDPVRVIEYRNRLGQAIATGSERPPLPERLSYSETMTLSVERLRGLPLLQLQQQIDWLNSDAAAAYEVLGLEHWDVVRESLRQDTAERFARIRRESLNRLAEAVARQVGLSTSTTARALVTAKVEESLGSGSDSFLQKQFAAAALHAIAVKGSSDDLAFVRSFLDDVIERDRAIEAIARIGSLDDVPSLLRIASESHGATKAAAASAALRLSGDSADVLNAFISSNDSDLVALALEKIEAGEFGLFRDKLIALLYSDNDDVRLVAVGHLVKVEDRGALEGHLERYVAEPRYYYNVVVALDRALYRLVGLS